MSVNESHFSAGDCCLTGVAGIVLLGQGSWLLAKRSFCETVSSGKAGWRETGRTAQHLYNGSGTLRDSVSALVLSLLTEIGALFPDLWKEMKRTGRGGLNSLYSASECVGASLSPLVETRSLMAQGALETKRFFKGALSHSTVEVLDATVVTTAQEIWSATKTGAFEVAKTGISLYRTGPTFKAGAHYFLEGYVDELIELFVQGLDETKHGFNGTKTAIQNGLQVSKNSSFRLIIEGGELFGMGWEDFVKFLHAIPPATENFFEMASAPISCFVDESAELFGVGSKECTRVLNSLPPALKAFFQTPFDGLLALLKECLSCLKIGAQQTKITFTSLYRAARVGVEILEALLLGILYESFSTLKTGCKETKNAFLALALAIRSGTEWIYPGLCALLHETWSTVTSEIYMVPRAAVATGRAIYNGGSLAAVACAHSLQEAGSSAVVGGRETVKTFTSTFRALKAGSEPLADISYRMALESFHVLKSSGSETKRTLTSTLYGTLPIMYVLSDLPFRSACEIKSLGPQLLRETSRFMFQMTDEVPRLLDVHVFYPLERTITPKIEAVRAFGTRVSTRMDQLLASINTRMEQLLASI